METPVRTRASVEIETMARGTPKIKVRIDDDDSDIAREEALRVYWHTLAALKSQVNRTGKGDSDDQEDEQDA